MSEFRDAIAQALTPPSSLGTTITRSEACADAVLAMPEMQAIREYVKVTLAYFSEHGWPSILLLEPARRLHDGGVSAWVLGDDQ